MELVPRSVQEKELKLQKELGVEACNSSFLGQNVCAVCPLFILNENTHFPGMPFQPHKDTQSGALLVESLKRTLNSSQKMP